MPRSKGFGPNYASRKSAREGASANPLRRGFEPGVAAGAKADGCNGCFLDEAIGLGFSRKRVPGLTQERGSHLAAISETP